MNDARKNQGVSRRSFTAGLGAFAIAGVPARLFAAGPKDTVARTVYGKVKGGIDSNGAIFFKGLPYGADTSGKNRYLPPQKPASWSGVRDATQYADNCLQPRAAKRSPLMQSFQDPPHDSENCLTLNVWTPATDGKKRPVMVWLHGGGFDAGSGNNSNYNGYRLAMNQDVVVVTINHRLGIFGYLYLGGVAGEKYANTGNQGQLDQIAALEWVRDNIANFGGDAGNVTIFGESGGGGKVCALLGMPSGKGLYHRAIIESGPRLTGVSKEAATETTRFLMKELGLAENDIEGLQKVPGEKLLAAYGKIRAVGLRKNVGPVVNGTDMPRATFLPDASPVSRDVPVMIGCTKDEGSLFFWLEGTTDVHVFDFGWEELPKKIEHYAPGLDTAAAIAAFRKIEPKAKPGDVLIGILSQTVIRSDTVAIADTKARQGGAPVYAYLMTWPTPVNGGIWGATHIVDVPLQFDNISGAASLIGTPEENKIQPLADKMSAAWAQFARTGNPNVPSLPHWPAYDEKQRPTMVFDRVCKVENDPGHAERQAVRNAMVPTKA